MKLLVIFYDIIIINMNKNYKKNSISSDLTFQNNPILQYKIKSVISFN